MMSDSNWYTFKEAGELLGKSRSYFQMTYRRNPHYFKEGTFKKSGRIWLISDEGIDYVLNQIKKVGVRQRTNLQERTTKQKRKFCFYPQLSILTIF